MRAPGTPTGMDFTARRARMIPCRTFTDPDPRSTAARSMDATAEELIARLRRNPDDASAYAALRAHYQRIGDYPSLANLLEGFAGRSADAPAAAQSFFDAGEIV